MGKLMREMGLSYLLTAHTQDDQAETCLMRYDRHTGWRGAAGIARKVYAPVWPELACVTLCRPLLGCSRETLRDYNRAHDLNWLNDPSNDNRDFTRIRARDYLRERPILRRDLLKTAKDLRQGRDHEEVVFADWLRTYATIYSGGYVRLKSIPTRALMSKILCAMSGKAVAPSNEAMSRMLEAIRRSDFKSRTLGGALVVKEGGEILIGCDPAEVKGRNAQASLAPICYPVGVHIWNGRYLVKNSKEVIIAPAKGYIGKLLDKRFSYLDNQAFQTIPAAFRPCVPILLPVEGVDIGSISIELLAYERLNLDRF